MTYIDFSYYQDFFKDTLISDETTFRAFLERVSEFIDTASFDRPHGAELLNRHKTKTQKCICDLAEQFFRWCFGFRKYVENFRKYQCI